MRILICEDEAPARKRIQKLILASRPHASIVGTADTGKKAKEILKKEKIDLVFLDIELADGPCFETLHDTEINAPVIFTTAYDEYALKAFEMNSIDYLVKPITQKKMDNAFQKLDAITESIIEKHSVTISREMLSEKKYKDRFLVKLGRRLIPINASEIAYFQAEEKMVFLVLKKGKRYIINYTLSELEELMNPREFFRLNRQFVANHSSITELEPYFKGQVIAKLDPAVNSDIVISRGQTPLLKEWLGG